jgi:hypothetical protein
MNPSVIIVPNAEVTGIGNRVKSYVSFLSRYDIVKTQKIPDYYSFENFSLATISDLQKYPSFNHLNTHPRTDYFWRLLVDPEEEQYLDEYSTIDLLYHKIPEYFRNKYIPVFKQLKLRKGLENIVKSIVKDWDTENMIGVSIRTYLNPGSDPSRNAWVDLQKFEDEIEKIPSDQKFFFCSDSIRLNQYYLEKYKSQIITFPRKVDTIINDNIDDITQTQEALIEMYLLSYCRKKIITTFGSTFPECAWWLGECNAEVVIPVDLNKVPKEFIEDHFRKKQI